VERNRWGRGSTYARRLLPLVGLLLLVACSAACDAPQSTAVIAGSDNRALWGPYNLIMWMAGIVFVAIMALTLAFSIMFRERPGRVARQFHGNNRLEVIWTLIPVAIVVVMAVPTITTIQAQAKAPEADAIKVVATGHQWWFEFSYPDAGVTTANELHIPEGKTIAFEIRSTDVIHSFWVPQLAGKIDMVPGHVNHIHFSADTARPEPYLGQCAELCGLSHANMRFRVFVDTPSDYEAWLQNAKAAAAKPASPLATQGQEIFMRSACIGCHTVNGTAAAGKIGPDLSHVGARTTIASGTLQNNDENLVKWIHNSADIKPGSKMPPMAKAAGGALSDDEIQAVAAYLLGLK
jgi:cytochrome c oxidase subunit 2